jgi:hypothetical protein
VTLLLTNEQTNIRIIEQSNVKRAEIIMPGFLEAHLFKDTSFDLLFDAVFTLLTNIEINSLHSEIIPFI